jgi:ribosome maturation factor RimP
MQQAVEHKISNLIKDTVETLGFDLVKVSIQGATSNVLEILIDRLDNTKVSIADCRTVSKNISAVLDVEDVISDKYYLHVASCGVERPLVKFEDYQRFLNHDIKVKLKEPVEGRSKYKGVIFKAENNDIEIILEDKKIISTPFDNIKGANLVLTDEMFRKLLNKSDQENSNT